jgi:hypothetical protein
MEDLIKIDQKKITNFPEIINGLSPSHVIQITQQNIDTTKTQLSK